MGRGKRGKAKKKPNIAYSDENESISDSLKTQNYYNNSSEQVLTKSSSKNNLESDEYISIFEKRYYVNRFIHIYWNRLNAYEPIEDIIIENDSDDSDELNYEEY